MYRDVEPVALDASLEGGELHFPDFSELEVTRHFTLLSQWNFEAKTGMYP
jgi:hypothetical protein